MKIFDNIYLIGSGRFGSCVSNRYDCNVYAIDLGSEIAIIDGGVGLEPERIVVNAEKFGLNPNEFKYLLLTHYHGDHAGGSHFWKREFNVEVFGSREGASWLEEANEEAISLRLAKEAGGYPADYILNPCPVDHQLDEGDVVDLPGLQLKVINTPGHSNGHVSYYGVLNGVKILLAGDTVFPGGKILLQNIYDCNIQNYAASVEKLANLEIDVLLAGHQMPILSNGSSHIQIANDVFKHLGIPQNLG